MSNRSNLPSHQSRPPFLTPPAPLMQTLLSSHRMLLTAALATLLLSAGGLLRVTSAQASMPLPFTRQLQLTTPALQGQDIYILQNMLSQNGNMPLNVTSEYDAATEQAVSLFQRGQGLAVDGIVGPVTAQAVLDQLSDDRYRDDGVPPAQLGYLYKVYVPVYRNRSVETMASLIAANGSTVFQFQARLHGIDTVLQPWPYFNSCCDGLNMFSSNGDTPTGLIELDLNTPEPGEGERAMGEGREGRMRWRDAVTHHYRLTVVAILPSLVSPLTCTVPLAFPPSPRRPY